MASVDKPVSAAGMPDPKLTRTATVRQGASLPVMNASWYGKPVEEVDPMIFEDTFCVVSKKFGRSYIYRYSSSKSLFLLGPMNPLRRFAIYITTHRFFDILIVITILCNCVTLAMITNYFGEDGKRLPNTNENLINNIETVFLGIYSIEMVLKITAKGMVLNRFSYMRNRWNLLDLIVVFSGYITLVQDLFLHETNSDQDNYLEFLRTFRVLRVVKTISILPGLKMMINALLSSVTQLFEVMALTIVCLMIFSLFALEVFQGRLRQKCVIDKGGPMDPERLINKPIEEEDEYHWDRIWTEWVSNWKNWQRRSFPEDEPIFCGNGSSRRKCEAGYTCIGFLGDNPDDGWTSFESFFNSMLSTFQLLTLDYWERLYDIVLSTCGIWSMLFFLLVIFLGAYYLLNLMLAVVAMSYENEATLQEQGPLSVVDRLGLTRRQSNFSFDQLSKLNICKMTHYRKRTKSEREQLAKRIKMSTMMGGDHGSHGGLDNPNLRLDDAIFNLLGMKLALGGHEKEATAGSFIEPSQLKSEDEENAAGEIQSPKASLEGGNENLSQDRSRVDMDFGQKVVSHLKLITPSVIEWQSKLSALCRRKLQPFVNHQIFEWFITICIILNTIVLAIEHHGETKELENLLKNFNSVFMGVFTFECIVKVMALQRDYFHSGWNIFDMVIVAMSYLDLSLSAADNGTSGSSLSVLRSIRLLRVFKLAQSWVTMKVLLNIIFSSFGALGNLTCVLLIIIYIFAVMGMQVIGENYSPGAFDKQQPQWHFRHFWYAFMMVFRVLCGEWIEPLWECLKAQGFDPDKSKKKDMPFGLAEEETKKNPMFLYSKCFIIFLPILIVGNFIVLNLFLALLLNSFDTEELNAQRERELEAMGRAENLKNIVGLLMKKETNGELGEEEPADETASERGSTAALDQDRLSSVPSKAKKRSTNKKMSEPKKGSTGSEEKTETPMKSMHRSVVESPALKRWRAAVALVILHIRIAAAERAIARMENRRARRHNMSMVMADKMLLGNPAGKESGGFNYDQTPESSEDSEALTMAGDCIPAKIWQWRFCPCKRKTTKRKSFVFARRWDNLRSACVSIVSHYLFEYSILMLIFASSITLCFEDIHLDKNVQLKQALCILNYTFTAIFFVEMILKWFAIGIWGYFTGFWTLLDGFIVVVSCVSAYFDITLDVCSGGSSGAKKGSKSNLGALKALRTLRALRPLRAISRWEGMKIVVNALFYAIPSIFNVLLVCLLFWLIFSIMGVQFFKGQFYRCVNAKGDRVAVKQAPNKDVCCAKALTHSYSWINAASNYDNVFEGYLSLLQVATFEGWIELMAYSVDAAGVDIQPREDNQIEYYAFYVVFIIFGSFFTLQLFIGVIIDNFNVLKKKYEGNMLEILLTPTQRNYYIAMKNLGRKKPKPVIQRPRYKYMGFFYDIAMSRRLEVIIYIMIFLNMVLAGFEQYGQGMMVTHILNGCNAFFTTVYCLEAFIKIVGLGTLYFTVPWNVFDFVLVGASLMDAFIEGDLSVSLPIPPTMLRIVRVVRIGRILRLVRSMQGIRKLLFALVVSLPALINIGALLALVTFIYAILGMALFGNAPKKWSVDEMFNFDTFLNSNLMLLRLMTAAGWNEVLDSLTVIEPLCGTYRHIVCGRDEYEKECPNRALVVAYIVSYLILTYLIVINLYIAIILENYVEASNEEDVGIVEDDLEIFYIRWSIYDPFASQFIDFNDLTEFLDSLDPPLQLPKPNIVAIVAFNLPIARGNKIHCLDILQALITHVLGQVDDSREFKKLQGQMAHKFQKQFPNRRLLDIVSNSRRWKLEQNAAIIIQRAWRAYWARTHTTSVPQKQDSNTPTTTNVSAQNKEVGKTDHGGMGHMMGRMGNTPSKQAAP